MASPADVCAPAEVPLEGIERELDRQLKQAQGPGESPVVRARMSNLVIYTDRNELCDRVSQQVPDLVAQHPARVILLAVDPDVSAGRVAASVHTRIHHVGTGLRAFSELVTLRVNPSNQGKLSFALRRLVIGDLPTNLWWAVPQPPAMGGTLLFEIAEGAQQVIYDSYGWPEPARGLTATASWLERFERPKATGGRRRIASDLTWRRLKPWRRMVAEALDPATAPGAMETVDEVLVDHGPHSVTSAWTLASWMIHHLGWRVAGVKVKPGQEISWRLTSDRGPCSMRIRRIADAPRGIQWMRIGCEIDGQSAALDLAPVGDRRLKIEREGVDAAPRTITVSDRSMTELIARQLTDREWDPSSRRAMEVAQDLAISVLKSS